MIKVNTPDNKNQLKKARTLLLKIEKKCESRLNEEDNETMYGMAMKILETVSSLSIPLFKLRNELEDKYTNQYKKSPALGRKLFLEHYEGIHKPYDKIKDRCYKIMEKLDSRRRLI